MYFIINPWTLYTTVWRKLSHVSKLCMISFFFKCCHNNVCSFFFVIAVHDFILKRFCHNLIFSNFILNVHCHLTHRHLQKRQYCPFYVCKFTELWLWVFNATFHNISVIMCLSVLLVVEPEAATELPQVTDKQYNKNVYLMHPAKSRTWTDNVSADM